MGQLESEAVWGMRRSGLKCSWRPLYREVSLLPPKIALTAEFAELVVLLDEKLSIAILENNGTKCRCFRGLL